MVRQVDMALDLARRHSSMNAMTTIKGWARELIDLSLLFIAVGVVVQIIFGKEDSWYFGTVTDRLIGFVQQLGDAGFVGLIALVVIIYVFSKRGG
jgi:hypothetical protein